MSARHGRGTVIVYSRARTGEVNLRREISDPAQSGPAED